MKLFIRILSIIITTAVFISCSSTLHLYSGQRYFADEELGTLTVSEQFQIFKFDGKLVQKTPKPPVIKALPGKHELDYSANLSESDSDAIESTIFWEAVEGHIYELVFSDSEAENVMIVDVTNSTSL